MEQSRKIIHIDMDAFFASVEQEDNPELQNKPIAVGGGSKRGVVAAASYEARRFGVRSAMSGELARKLCEDLIFVKPRFSRYKEISKVIHSIFLEYTDLVEALSLDEAYLDVTSNKKGVPSASLLANEIREKIFEITGLTASAGISINKFIAKVASDYNKPNGQKTIPPEEVLSFLSDLDVRKFHGVGKVTADKMYRLGLYTGADLRNQTISFLEDHFGKSGHFFYDVVRGNHFSPVRPKRKSKSVGAERTFDKNISSEVFMTSRLDEISASLDKRIQHANLSGKTVTLKIKYSDFVTQTRSKTMRYFTSDISIILETAKELLFQDKLTNSVRLLGISLSNFKTETQEKKLEVQLKLLF
ncbi:MAG: DNA polymerase IV [Flavobacteriaceae bacterium]|jgi:DNA polymerase-4|nr:DNA polymerase IV [Flavobacteriaceae bacterium]MBT7459272.1 DNA polymerase IV [Flavobacteriaceae bacterium]MCH1384817.1 DNA polymerase IV [Flavobacteriaceae bacterium]MDG0968166.1 DNA polymerase IV [Flavobacteriaceae bacterium]